MARRAKPTLAMQPTKETPKDYSDDEIIAALTMTKGMVTLAAKQLGCAESTIYRRIKISDAVADAITVARERTLDFAELKLVEHINKGNVAAVIFYLKTQGKSRGYIERSEVINIPPEVQTALNEANIKIQDFWAFTVNELKALKAEQSIKTGKDELLQ